MADLTKTLISVRLIGIRNALLALRNAQERDRLDARFALPTVDASPPSQGKLLSAEPVVSGARLQLEAGELNLKFLAPDLFVLTGKGVNITPSYAVEKSEWPEVPTTLDHEGAEWCLASDQVELRVSGDGAVEWGERGEPPLGIAGPLVRRGRGWNHTVRLSQASAVYGLGERAGRLNLRPGIYRFWNTDLGGSFGPGIDPLYITMPVYLCLQEQGSYLAFYDNTYDGRMVLDDRATIHFEDGPFRLYIAVGTPEQVLKRFTEVTGRAPLPPRWALGYQHSRWGLGNEEEARRVWREFEANHLPLSVLYLNGDHLRGFRTLTVDTNKAPTLRDLANELRRSDVHLVAITNPAIKVESGNDLYERGRSHEVFAKTPDGKEMHGVVWPGMAAFPDFTNPRVRSWWGQQYARSLNQGIDGFWNDMNEPSSFCAWGDLTLPLCTRHDLEGRGGDHREAHNVYGMMMDRAAYEGLRQLLPENRPFILSRSGWVGLQRYAWSWTGDVESTWEIMRTGIASVLGLGLSGIPYSGPDIGGYSGEPSSELFVRWFELASFLPFFRTHCAKFLGKRDPWEFGGDILQILRAQLELRYHLLPYWYTLAWDSSLTGLPLVRPLFWSEPRNPGFWEIDDAFMVGDALLVAPVTYPGATSQTVSLPSGGWYELVGDQYYAGSQTVTLEAPLASIPVLVRAGSILPIMEESAIVLHIYRPLGGQAGSGVLYSDAGDGYGTSRVDRFHLQPVNEGYEFTWATEGDYPWPYASVKLVLHGMNATYAKIGDETTPFIDNRLEVCQGARVQIAIG